jgi:hypothetical protein
MTVLFVFFLQVFVGKKLATCSCKWEAIGSLGPSSLARRSVMPDGDGARVHEL